MSKDPKTLYSRLFKLNSDGETVQMWEIHIAENDESYWTVSGQVDGKKVTSSPTQVIPKVNRTQREQILLEVDAKVLLKARKKYVNNINDIGEKADKELPGYSAMLAKKWEDQRDKINFPCMVQPKLDGVRCLATKDGLFSRGRKIIEACQHVRDALAPFFAKHPTAYLDGELYTHEFKDDFESIISAVRKTGKRVAQEDLDLQAKVQYHIYDAPRIDGFKEEDLFSQRFQRVSKLLPKHDSLRLVTTKYVDTEEQLYEIHNEFLASGYEGTMVRNTTMPYKGSRSSELLKMKEFDDDEFEILGVNEGQGGLVGHAATFTMKMPNGAEFRAKMEGSFERLKDIWDNPKTVIGRMCTVVYQGLTNKEGVPRFPVVKGIRDAGL
jgi:DNA ligase-1